MFEDKLKERYEVNRKALDTALDQFFSMLNGERGYVGSETSQIAINSLLKYFKLDAALLPSDIRTKDEIKQFLKFNGLFCHHVNLEGKWWKNASGPLLTTDSDGHLVALLPSAVGYRRVCRDGTKRVNAKTFEGLSHDGLNFFNLMARKRFTVKEFISYCLKSVPVGDYLLVFASCAIATLLSLLVPVANKIMFSEVVPSGIIAGILPICALLLGAGISSVLFTLVRNFVVVRVRDKINANVQPALFARILTLPSNFFRTRSASDLSMRVLAANNVYQILTSQLMGMMAASIFAILYIIVAFMYAKSMVLLVTSIIVAYLIIYVVLIRKYSQEFAEKIPNAGITQDFTYGVLTGIHKIKNNRAEFRAYSQWAERYSKSEDVTAKTSSLLKYGKILGSAVFSFGNLLVWIIAWRSGMAVSDFIAFLSAFGVMQTTLFTLTTQLQNIAQMVPYVKLLVPILEAEPEINVNRVSVSNITGSIDINHVSFSYDKNSPKVLDDVTLHIRSGENIGLVGSSGCGKSTLMRIMLGFEKPDSGSVFYGQYNMENVNMGTLRQYIGYCPQFMQVFPGTIAENIRLAAPMSTDEEVWEAARIASLDEDIRRMPLQMETTVGEGGSGLSGGQCQRLLIARSVINKPKVLFFDEATAALDNITQRNVVNNLAAFGCTRISIAHRLSTVMDCDRIVVLDKGKIVEEGSPKELLAEKGFFYNLCIRQQ
ncbi:MAG: ATP-binding cassette domain-containing protein [Bacteroidales bacterium]|nr:ATP-binding cassette domain-containing protein [Candidatus Cacconaster merdequi]